MEYLAENETRVEQFTITLDDGHGGTIEVTVIGTNDDPVVAALDVTGAVTEAVTPAGNLTDSGTIAFTDVDLTDTHSIDPTIVASPGALGALTADMSTDTTGSGLGGVVTWNYSVAASDVEYLAENETRVEQFTIPLDDGHGGTIDHTIEVTVTGTNDAVAISSISPLNLDEQTDTDPLTATIPITFTDVDLQDDHTAQITGVSASGVTGGLALDNAALLDLMTTGNVVEPTGSTPGSFDLHLEAPFEALDYLDGADVLTLTYTLEIDDLHSIVPSQTSVVIHITGVSNSQMGL